MGVSARPKKQARSPLSFAAILFAVLTVATLFFQLWAAAVFQVGDRSLVFYVIALTAAILVGGVGTGLATWGDGTAFFKEVLGMTHRAGKRKGPTG